MDLYTELGSAEDALATLDDNGLVRLDSVREGPEQAERAPEVPVGPAYAQDPVFWRLLVMAMVYGSVMGLIGFGYLQSIEKFQELWWGDDYGKSGDSAALGNGEWEWVLWTTGGGLVVGLLKLGVGFPTEMAGFFTEVQNMHVDWRTAPKMVLVSMVSLMSGASMGPEAAMGSLGGGIAQWWSETRGLSKEMTETHVLNGMAAAVGPLFPSPAISVVCMIEIGKPEAIHAVYMRTVVMMTFAACSSFAVYFALNDTGAFLPFNPLELTYEFKSGDSFKAALIGVVAGIVGFVHVVIAGVFKAVFARLNARLPPKVGTVMLPVIGGALFGLIAVGAPMTLGSGSKQTMQLIKLSWLDEISTEALFVTSLAKSATFAISKGAGFQGGAIFPMVTVGASFGLAVAQLINNHDHLELLLSVSCFMAAIPAAITPAPIMLLLMVAFSFNLGAHSATPIFVACAVAHLVTCGMGLVLSLLNLAQRRQASSLA